MSSPFSKRIFVSLISTLILVALSAFLSSCNEDPVIIEGKSAYELAVENGFEGTEQDWLISLGMNTFNYDIAAKCAEFSALFNGKENVDSFLYFTDPHLTYVTSSTTQNYINFIEEVYDSTPTSFVLCGGDWLTDSDTQSDACFKLGYIDGMMKSRFDRYYPVVGNHDTNYQGTKDADSEKNTGFLSDGTVAGLWYRDTGSSYYSFNTVNARYIVLDTQLDWDTTLKEFDKAQLKWFADELIKNDTLNNVICMHMLWEPNANDSLTPFVSEALDIMEAYNAKASYSLDGEAFDFSGCVGNVSFIMAGHSHRDELLEVKNIPVIITANLQTGEVPLFDLVLVDWDERNVYLTRVGDGENRTVDMFDPS